MHVLSPWSVEDIPASALELGPHEMVCPACHLVRWVSELPCPTCTEGRIAVSPPRG